MLIVENKRWRNAAVASMDAALCHCDPHHPGRGSIVSAGMVAADDVDDLRAVDGWRVAAVEDLRAVVPLYSAADFRHIPRPLRAEAGAALCRDLHRGCLLANVHPRDAVAAAVVVDDEAAAGDALAKNGARNWAAILR